MAIKYLRCKHYDHTISETREVDSYCPMCERNHTFICNAIKSTLEGDFPTRAFRTLMTLEPNKDNYSYAEPLSNIGMLLITFMKEIEDGI